MKCCDCQAWRLTYNEEAITVMGGDAICSFHARERIKARDAVRAPSIPATVADATKTDEGEVAMVECATLRHGIPEGRKCDACSYAAAYRSLLAEACPSCGIGFRGRVPDTVALQANIIASLRAERVKMDAVVEDYRHLLDLVGDTDREIMEGYLAGLAMSKRGKL